MTMEPAATDDKPNVTPGAPASSPLEGVAGGPPPDISGPSLLAAMQPAHPAQPQSQNAPTLSSTAPAQSGSAAKTGGQVGSLSYDQQWAETTLVMMKSSSGAAGGAGAGGEGESASSSPGFLPPPTSSGRKRSAPSSGANPRGSGEGSGGGKQRGGGGAGGGTGGGAGGVKKPRQSTPTDLCQNCLKEGVARGITHWHKDSSRSTGGVCREHALMLHSRDPVAFSRSYRMRHGRACQKCGILRRATHGLLSEGISRFCGECAAGEHNVVDLNNFKCRLGGCNRMARFIGELRGVGLIFRCWVHKDNDMREAGDGWRDFYRAFEERRAQASGAAAAVMHQQQAAAAAMMMSSSHASIPPPPPPSASLPGMVLPPPPAGHSSSYPHQQAVATGNSEGFVQQVGGGVFANDGDDDDDDTTTRPRPTPHHHHHHHHHNHVHA